MHGDRLRALLDKPVVLSVHWNNGDAEATVTVMPADGVERPDDGDKPFETLRLQFPD